MFFKEYMNEDCALIIINDTKSNNGFFIGKSNSTLKDKMVECVKSKLKWIYNPLIKLKRIVHNDNNTCTIDSLGYVNVVIARFVLSITKDNDTNRSHSINLLDWVHITKDVNIKTITLGPNQSFKFFFPPLTT